LEKYSNFSYFDHVVVTHGSAYFNEGVYLSGTIYWFSIQNKLSFSYYHKDFTVEQFVFISLDLDIETYKHLLGPPGVDEVPDIEPTIAVLMDCLCFSHILKRTHFVIWQMTEFGVEQSWTQFVKISFQNIQVEDKFRDGRYHPFFMFPSCLSENGDTLMLVSYCGDKEILYYLRDNRAEQASGNKIIWSFSKDYVESKFWSFTYS